MLSSDAPLFVQDFRIVWSRCYLQKTTQHSHGENGEVGEFFSLDIFGEDSNVKLEKKQGFSDLT